MKKLTVVLMLMAMVSTTVMSCASQRGTGCPTTNKKYFRA